MFRLSLLLVIGLSLAGCANSQAVKELEARLEAKRIEKIEAGRIPEAKLSQEQVAKLKALAPQAQIIWYRAGRQADGKIFVCHVTEGKTIFGRTVISLSSGTFEADGSYQRTPAYLWSSRAVREDCRAHGFEPPVSFRGIGG